MCGVAAGYDEKPPYLKTTRKACESDQKQVRGAPICCKEGCCKQLEWYERWETWVMVGLALCIPLCAYAARYVVTRRKDILPSVLRQSLLGGEDRMPDALLVGEEVGARWAAARQTQQGTEMSTANLLDAAGDDDDDEIYQRYKSSQEEEARSDVRRRKGQNQQLHVMFTDAHIRELKPGNMGWRKQVIGQGTYGKVYKATVSCCFSLRPHRFRVGVSSYSETF